MNKIMPKSLKYTDTIGVIAPASPCELEKTERYCRLLTSCGFNVQIGESALSNNGYLAGNDILRAHDLIAMFENDSIDAIFCLRGGYGSTRILDMLDFEVIRKHPKIFLGFSDITALHNSINSFSELITFHGPSVSNCEWGGNDFRFRECMRILQGGSCVLKGECCYNMSFCRGEICGGNLTLVESLIGTKYETDVQDKILLLEDVGEKNYSIDRRLNHLRMAGYFKSCRAVVLGRFTDGDEYENNNIPLKKIVEDIIVPCGKPIILGADFGHIPNNPTIPMGIVGTLENCTVYIPSAVHL